MAKSTAEAKTKKTARKARRRQQKVKSIESLVGVDPSESKKQADSTVQPDRWPGARLQFWQTCCFPSAMFRHVAAMIWGCSRRFIQQNINRVMEACLECRSRSRCTFRLAAVPDHQGGPVPQIALMTDSLYTES